MWLSFNLVTDSSFHDYGETLNEIHAGERPVFPKQGMVRPGDRSHSNIEDRLDQILLSGKPGDTNVGTEVCEFMHGGKE